MDISLFRRGIRLPRRPSVRPLEELPPPKKALLPLSQTAGPAFEQLVKPGDKVKMGAALARSAAGDELHAPISGQIRTVSDFLSHDGTRCKALAIESDGGDEASEEAMQGLAISTGADVLLERVRKAGVVQVGRDARPLAALIEEAKAAGKVGHLAVRFSDPDPYMGTLEAVTAGLDGDPADLGFGVDLLKKIAGAEKIHFVLEKEQRAAGVERIAADKSAEVHRFDAFEYPALADELIARTILGRDNDIIPNQVHKSGVLVVDADALLDAAAAVKSGTGVTSKVITVFGPKGARTLKARIGTPISEIVDAIGERTDMGKVVLGGPLLGRAAYSLDVPLTKDVRGLTLQTDEEVSFAADHQCLSCGLCSMVCPMRLVPGLLSRYCEYGHWDKAEQARLFTCIECGCCAYVCPAGRSMVQLFTHGKNEVRAARQEVGQ